MLAWVRQVYLLAWVRRVYLIASFHFTLFWTMSCCIFNILSLSSVLLLQSPYTSLPNCLFHSFTVSKPPLPSLCMQFLILTNPWRSQLLRRLCILQCHITHPLYHHHVTLHIHCTIIMSHYTSTVPSSCHITHPLYHHHVTLHIHCTIIMSHYTSTVPSSCHITHPLYHHHVTLHIHCTIIMSHYTSTVPSSCHITHPLYHHHVISLQPWFLSLHLSEVPWSPYLLSIS